MNHLRYHQTQPLHLPGRTQSLMKGKCSHETSEESRGTARVRAQVYSSYARAGHLPRALGSRSSADRCQPPTAAPETSPILFACPPAEEALWTLTASSQGWMSHPLCPVGVPLPQDPPASGRETPGAQPPWTPQTSCSLLPSCPSPPPSYIGHPSSRRGPYGELTVSPTP